MSVSRRITRGDIFEIETPRGLAYFQVTHRDAVHGYLIRVLDRIFEHPAAVSDLADLDTRFLTFFPVPQALRENIVRHVGRAVVPRGSSAFPVMKVPGLRDSSGRVEKWWLWNGVEEWAVESLSPEQAAYPTAAVINDTMLIDRITSDWRHEDDVLG